MEKHRRFEELRRNHYNMKEAMHKAQELLQKEENENDNELTSEGDLIMDDE